MKKLLFLTVSCIVFLHQAAHAMSPLHIAAADGNIAQVTALLNIKGTDVNQTDGDGWTPLHHAAGNGHEEVIRLLLEHGANVNQQTKDGYTPSLFAALFCHKTVARLLLEHGANPNLAAHGGDKPLAYPFVKTIYTEILQQRKHAARLAILMVSHPRTGARSSVRHMPAFNINQIFAYLQPEDFLPITSANHGTQNRQATAAIPAHTTPAPVPTLSQQALATAQNILSNPRVQIAAATITALSFVAWRLLHH